MKHLILGTAGHVDHGKTTLIKALTSKDCDTHKEEKQRGITIHLGFAHLDLPDGNRIGIVDVPGHKDFIHTMVAGATGIDFVLLVIAADSSIMPQTREHLEIMQLLGIKNGIVVLSRTDLVDDELIELCRLDIESFVEGTFYDGAPVIEVSAKTGKGIEELKTEIFEMSKIVQAREINGIFKMYIDRIFSISGFGTVVTGTVSSGKINQQDKIYLCGSVNKELRIKKMERHGEETELIQAGDRASLNLAGLNRSEFDRGMLLSDRELASTQMVDALLSVIADNTKLKLWSNVILHSGTFEAQARVHLIDANSLSKGETAVVQIHFEKPCYIQFKDRFVIRRTSGDKTIGGGEIIDPAPLHHRRRPDKLLKELERLSQGDICELVYTQLLKEREPVEVEQLAKKINLDAQTVIQSVNDSNHAQIIKFRSAKGMLLVAGQIFENYQSKIVEITKAFRAKNKLLPRGIEIEEIRTGLKLDKTPEVILMLNSLLKKLVSGKKLKQVESSWYSADETGIIDEKLSKKISLIQEHMQSWKMQTPLMSQIEAHAKENGINKNELKQILNFLVNAKKLYKIDGEFIHQSIVDCCRDRLIQYLKENNDGITVSGFRDLVKGNRKICLLLLSQFDSEKLTKRDGDYRKLV